MLYGDDPLKLNNYTYAPSLAAIIQSGNLYVYAMSNPTRYVDPNGEIAWAAVLAWLATPAGQVVLGGAVGGITTGITYSLDGKSFFVGLLNGAVSGAISGRLSRYGPSGAFMGSVIGSAAGTLVETFALNPKAFNDPEMRNEILNAAIEGAIAGVPAAYWKSVTIDDEMIDCVVRELMEYDKDFGMLIESFFSGLMTALTAKENQ